MLEQVNKQIIALENGELMPPNQLQFAKELCQNGACQILSKAEHAFEILVEDIEKNEPKQISIRKNNDAVNYLVKGKESKWDFYGAAALLKVKADLEQFDSINIPEGKMYTRAGMIKRVLDERKEKALKANYRILFANNIFGEHILYNEKGQKYKVTLRDFENETGYIDNPDWKTNKLGTTKHIMFAFQKLKSDMELFNRLDKTYPFVEIYTDPLNDYKITWHYPHELNPEIEALIDKYFGNNKTIEGDCKFLSSFIQEAREFPEILIRPEVEEKISKAWDKAVLEQVSENQSIDFSKLKVKLFPYQEEGVKFATFREGAIIADEMGLGKTLQAIGTAIAKKEIFGFKKTLIICPASLKEQWKQEIEKFTDESAIIAEGTPEQREELYKYSDAYFIILNYETVLRDYNALNKLHPDFIILDEAQKIKNYATITAQSIKLLKKKHALVITGTPIENRLIDLYSIVQFIDPNYLAPLWEFSYQHCWFDENNKLKITGYYNLQDLKERLKPILIRRTKVEVIKELPNISQRNIPIELHDEQKMLHAGFASGVASILRKKFMTPFDQQRLMLLLNNMRMVCDSSFLVDKETHHSPKLVELKEILLEKLDVKNKDSKIIIFSEWVIMLELIGKMLHENGIGYTMLTGKVQVKNRNKLVKEFETNPDCKIFLSTEAGGAGLNLQVADTVINFELPWNPAKKNQRIGRIDRIGQRSNKLTVLNFIAKDSIEFGIASGLGLKQNLFDSVLNSSEKNDQVDFSSSGKAQFMMELEAMMNSFQVVETVEEEAKVETETENISTQLSLNFTDESESSSTLLNEAVETTPEKEKTEQIQQMETVMNQGMEFLSGLFKMATGNSLGLEQQKIEVDKETGEVVFRFKLPVK
jgi:SNF2 family DNA or RNA helicase